MNDGWIKLYRQIKNNDIFNYDPTAWHIFEILLLSVDRNTGDYRGGRLKLARLWEINPNTLKSALDRLKKAKMVTTFSTNKFTIYHICNWKKYQQDDTSSSTNKTPTKHQQNTTITRSKELKNISTNVDKSVSGETARSVYEFYLQAFDQSPNRYKLTDARKLKLNARLKDAGPERLKQAISAVAASPFHQGDNPRGWKADLDFIIRSYEQVEKFANEHIENKPLDIKEALENL